MEFTTLQKAVNIYLQSVPTPPGVSSRDIVLKAIRFEHPPRIPYSFIKPLESDFFETTFLLKHNVQPENRFQLDGLKPDKKIGDVYYDEWGVGNKVTGREWDHAFINPLKDLDQLISYKFPDVAAKERYLWMAPFIRQAHEAGKFVIGFDPIMMYERMRALMGFEGLMLAHYTQPEKLRDLLEQMTDLVIAVIERWASLGPVDGFMTWDDFGLQDKLQIRIETFREFYKPFYARIVDVAHSHNMVYIWHNCGNILEMVPELIEIGVDVLQLDQPLLMGYDQLAEACGGKICLWNTLDIQWSTSEKITSADFSQEIARMVAAFEQFGGGFIARQYPAPQDINISEDDHLVIYESFMANGCALRQND